MAALTETGVILMPQYLTANITASRRTIPALEHALDPTKVVDRIDHPIPAPVQHLERTIIPLALCASDGRIEKAAEMLSLSHKGLYLKRQLDDLTPCDTALATDAV